MSTVAEFLSFALLLLAMPGPSNALLAAAGAERGFVRASPQIGVLVAAYALAIGGWSTLLSLLVDRAPMLLRASQLLAALLLVILAWRILWRSGRADDPVATPGRLFVTTLANPKALILALALLPVDGHRAWLPPLALIILATGLAWVAVGALALRLSGRRPSRHWIDRPVAAIYCGFGLYLGARGLGLVA